MSIIFFTVFLPAPASQKKPPFYNGGFFQVYFILFRVILRHIRFINE